MDLSKQNQLFATIVGLSTQLRQVALTLYSVDPLGTSEDVGRNFYYQDFVKGIGKANQVAVGDLGLQVLATQTGGLALSSSNDVVSLLQKCIADTQAYYELSFDPLQPIIATNITVSSTVVETRPNRAYPQGYYAQP